MAALLNRWLQVGLAHALVLGLCHDAVAGFSMSSWLLATSVTDTSGPSVVRDLHVINTVASPFDLLSATSVGPNTNDSHFQFDWNADVGNFLTTIDHYVETSDIAESLNGRVLVHATSDVLLTVNILLNYAGHPADEFMVQTFFRVHPETLGSPPTFTRMDDGGTMAFEPAVGSMNLSGEFVLVAGGNYWLQYFARTLYLDETAPISPISMNGTIHFTLQSIPEPATALLILAAAPLAILRRRR